MNPVISREYVEKNYIKITEMIKVIQEEIEKDYVDENGYIALSSIIEYLENKLLEATKDGNSNENNNTYAMQKQKKQSADINK